LCFLVDLLEKGWRWLGFWMSSKGPCVEGLVPNMRQNWNVVEPLRGGA
jgi:hypothetical protein